MPSAIAPRNRVFDRWDALLAFVSAACVFALYLRTLAPGILLGDSGEFQVLSYQVGAAHTTGYPVYILLAKLFITVFPLGDVANRVNVFSAWMGAVTIAQVFLCARLVTKSRMAAFLGGLALAVSSTFWSQAVIAEVYMAGAACITACLLAILIWHRTGNRWALFAAGVCGGVGLGIHASVVVFAPAVVLFLLLHQARWQNLWRPALAGTAAGVFLFLAAFFVVDWHNPPASSFHVIYGPARSAWGLSEADVSNPVRRMEFLISAGQWRGNLFSNPRHLIPSHARAYVNGLPEEFAAVSFLLIGIGCFVLLFQDWRLCVLFGTALVGHLVFCFNYDVSDIYVFYIPGYCWMAILASVGCDRVLGWLQKISRTPIRRAQWMISSAALITLLAVCLIPVVYPHEQAVRDGKNPFQKMNGYPLDGLTDAHYRLIRDTVSGLEDNALVLVDWDQLYMYWYAASIDGNRSGQTFIEQSPYHTSPGYPESTIQYIRANAKIRPVYLTRYLPEVANAGLKLKTTVIDSTQMYRVEEP